MTTTLDDNKERDMAVKFSDIDKQPRATIRPRRSRPTIAEGPSSRHNSELGLPCGKLGRGLV